MNRIIWGIHEIMCLSFWGVPGTLNNDIYHHYYYHSSFCCKPDLLDKVGSIILEKAGSIDHQNASEGTAWTAFRAHPSPELESLGCSPNICIFQSSPGPSDSQTQKPLHYTKLWSHPAVAKCPRNVLILYCLSFSMSLYFPWSPPHGAAAGPSEACLHTALCRTRSKTFNCNPLPP